MLGRRSFFKHLAGGAVGILASAESAGAEPMNLSSPQGEPAAAQSPSGPSALSLSNARVEFTLDAATGAFQKVRHKRLKRTFAFAPTAIAPVRVWIGTPDHLDSSEAIISQTSGQSVTYRPFTYSGGSGVELTWRSLKDQHGRETGILVQQVCLLDTDSEFLRLRTRVCNQGDTLLTGLFLGLQGITLGENTAHEVLSAPSGGGQQWVNPREKFANKPKVFCIPPTVPGSLACGWFDLSAEKGGFGIGYLNRRSMDMIGDAIFTPQEATLGWRMFRNQGGWTFMEAINGPLQVYPLRPGEEFTSDDWFFGFHEGDWHTTARHYRQEYERVFDGDFLTWEKTSPAARHADIIVNTTAAWGVMSADKIRHDLNRGEVRNRFLDIPAKVRQMIEQIGVRPANTLVVMLGQATHWGIYKLPDYFPVNQEAGGPADFKEMIRQLRQDVGVAGTHFYAHAAFNHPAADNYVKEADTGWSADLYSNFDHLGRIADMDDPEWWKLWRDKIIPGFAEAGASGIEFDEGFGHHFIPYKGRLENASAETILTAQLRGALRIFRACRKAFGPEGYLECEGGSDVGARYFDLWEGGVRGPVELVRYTHPDKLMTVFWQTPEDVNRAFVYGLPMLVSLGTSSPEFFRLLKQFVILRRQMREQQAPGYPYGFRDRDGLRLSDPGLFAKTYAAPHGITVVYYAPKPVTAEVIIEGRPLGHSRLGIQRHKLTLEAQQAGFWVLEAQA